MASPSATSEISLLEDGAAATRDALRRGDLEIAVVPDRPHDIDDLHYYSIGTERTQLLVRPGHWFAASARTTLDEIVAETLIAREGCLF